MSFTLVFWIVFAALLLIIIFSDRKYNMLRDNSTAVPPPYSWSRVQLAWWTVIVLASFIAIFLKREGDIPDLSPSTLILLGISGATTAMARAIDVSDQANPLILRHQDTGGSSFFFDIISDQNGPSIHRFQTIVFNFVFGAWFINKVLHNFSETGDIDAIMPVITDNNLMLLGLSSATYAAVKTMENKSTQNTTTITTTPPPPPDPTATGSPS